MSNTDEKLLITRTVNNAEKRDTYQGNLLKYKRAVKAECFLEALMIDYACLEDRLRYLLYYLGILSHPNDDKVGGKHTKEAINTLLDSYIKTGNRKIRTISGKRNYVKSIFLMLSDPEKTGPDNIYEKVLWKELRDDEKNVVILELLSDIEKWCTYRNEVVHDLMNKQINMLDMNLKEQAIYGNELFRKTDSIVRWVKRKQIPRKISIEITQDRKKYAKQRKKNGAC